MALPESTYDQFAISKLLKPTGDVYKPDIIPPSIPEFKLPANSSGIDLPYSYSKNKQNDNPVGASIDKLFNSGPTERFLNSPITYNADEINAARYVTSPNYHKLGISLYGDNEERYGQNQSWSEVLSNGTVGMGKLAYNGFDGWKGWGRMTDALIHWDWNKLHGDAESMMELDNNLKEIMNLNPIYATKEGTDTFWNRQTFGNFLQQSGFAVGAGVQMLSEQIITKAIEAGLVFTGVGAGAAAGLEAVEDVKTAANIGRMARVFQKTKEFYDAAKNFKALKKLGDVWKNEAILKNFVVGLGEKIPGIDIAMDMSKTYKIGKLAGLSKGQLIGDITKVGIGGLKRTLSEANFAFTEARMEAAGTFTDLYNQLQDDYYKKNGQFAKGDNLQFMQNTAMQAADKNFNFNSAVLAVSNRIMFDNIFKNSKATSKILSQFGEDVSEKGFKVLGKINNRTTTQYYTGSVFSNYKQIAADFGVGKARKVLAKSIMKPLLKFETTEGIQELLQEGSNEYFKDYYLDAYNSKFNPDIKASAEKSFGKAVGSQLNMQGLKTFASGALTGMIIHGPTVLVGKGISKIKDKTTDIYKTKGYTKEQKEEYYKEKEENKNELKNYYNEFNAIAKDPSKFFSESIKNFNIQKEGSFALDEAAKLGDKFAYENIRTDMLHSMVSQAVRNNTHEALIDTLREYGKNMSKEEFEQAFVGINYSSENKKSAQDYTEKVANSIESYAKTYNKLQDKYGSIANPNRYAKDSKQYMKELFKKKSLDDLIDILAGNEFKATDALNRTTEIYSKISSHKSLGSSLSSAFNILGSVENMKKELSVLDVELRIKKQELETEGLSKEDKERLKNEIQLKEEQHKAITEWSENHEELIDENKVSKSYAAYKKYLELKNKEFGRESIVNNSEIEETFVQFNDYMKLNKKAQNHVDAINMLSNPDYFDQVYTRMIEGQEMAYLQNLTNAAIDYIKSDKYKADENFIVQANGKYGVFTSTGIIVFLTDDLEEARKIKEELDKAIVSNEKLDDLLNDEDYPEEQPEEKEKENKQPEEEKIEPNKEFLINGKPAVIKRKFENEEEILVYEYYYEDIEPETTNRYFKKVGDKKVDIDTGEELILTLRKNTQKETIKEPTKKSIDEKIAKIQAKINALPNKGMVVEGEMITTSKEFDDLNKQIEDLKKQKEEPVVSTDAKAELQKKLDAAIKDQEERLKKLTIGTPIGGKYDLKVGDRYDADNIDASVDPIDNQLDPNFDPNIAENDGAGYSVISKVYQYGEIKDGKTSKQATIQIYTFNTKAEADAFLEQKKLNDEKNKAKLGSNRIIDKLKEELAALEGKSTVDAKADRERRRQEDNNAPVRQSVKYKLQNKIAGIDNPTPGNEIPTLSEAIKIAGSKLKAPIKINGGEITHVVFDQEESMFRFTYEGKQFAAFYIANARGKVRWEIAKFNDASETYQSVSLDELKNINAKYGSEKGLLLSLGAKDLVEDIENFEKVEYSKEDKSSGNGIIPLENTVSAEQIRLGKKYGVTYTLEDFLKQYDAELAALEGTTQPNIVTVYHHTTVAPKDFNFGSFQRGKNQISQFGDGLNASTVTNDFFVKRYGNPIQGEVNDVDFVVIDANMSQKEMYEMLAAKGFKFNNPQLVKATTKGGIYVGGTAASEYDSTDALHNDPGSAMNLFNDFQQSNPEVKGVKVINHIIGGQKADPFYVIYDAKSFYGPGSLSKIALETEQTGVEDIDQTFDDKKVIIDGDSKEFEKIFQDGIKQTAPALSVANRTHAVNVVEISPGIERFERGDVNQTYEFEVATQTFLPGQSIIFKVDEFDGKDYDNANIGIYSVLNGKETRIGAVHTPQWISEQKGSNNAYTHIVIPDSEKYDKLPKTLENELASNRKLRKVILDNYNLNSNFALNGTVNDKSNGIIVTMNNAGLLKDRINPKIGKGSTENRHGMFGIVRNGYIELSRGQKISDDKLVETKSFSSSEVANYEGYSVLLIPTPNGTFFPTFIKLPTVAREQSEFILKAWKVFTGRESGNDLINAVYNATGSTYVVGSKPNINILKSYINHYITNLSNKSLSQLGNGEDAPDNVSRIDIFDDGNIKLQGKKNGKWMSVTIRKEEDIPSDVLEYMDGLLTSVRFTDNKNDNLLGINNEDKFTLFGVKDGKLTSNNITYNQYIMNGAKTYLDKGIESKNEYKDWVYFANPVVKFQYSEPSKDSFKNAAESKKPEVTLTEVTDDENKKDKASSLLAALKALKLNNQQVKDQENNCSNKQ